MRLFPWHFRALQVFFFKYPGEFDITMLSVELIDISIRNANICGYFGYRVLSVNLECSVLLISQNNMKVESFVMYIFFLAMRQLK